MKGLAVILLSLVAVSCNKYGRRTTNRISDHPKCTHGSSGDFVMFRDDRDCGKFYECHRGTAFEFVCSEGQSFDLASRSCECSSIVDCSVGGISGSQDQPTPASDSASMPQARSTCNICRQAKESIPRHQNCPRTNGYYPVYFRNSKDCSLYYQCDQGTAYLIQCPAGLHFNTRINVCDYPQNVDCSGPVLVSPTYPSSSSGEGRTSSSCPLCQHARNVIPKHPNCPRSNGYYPAYFRHPTDCSTFYQCDNGSAYEIQCPAGLHFNTLLSVCDYPDKAGCSVTSGGVQESTSHTNGHQGFDGSASRTNGHQGSDGSVSRTNGHQGSAGAAFPTNGHQGVPGAVSQTNDHPKPGGSCNICRQAKESIPRHQNCPRANGYYPVYFRNSKDCSQYYQCDQGTAYLIQCPAGLHFNTRSNVCDYPQNVDCSGPVLVSPTYPSSSSGEGRTSPSCPICQHARNVIPKHPNCPRSNGYYPAYFRHPTDCSMFYQCDNGSAYEIQCPAGLHFNTLLSVCDYPAKAGCSPIQESTSHTNGHQGSDGSAFVTNGHQGSDGSVSRTNGHQGFDGSVSRTNGHQGSDGSVPRTNGHQGFDGSASRTNGHQGSDGSAFVTNGHQGSDGSVSRTNGHQGFDGSVSRTNGHQGYEGSASRTNGHQGFDGSVSRTNGHQGSDGAAFPTNGHQGFDDSAFRTNGHQGSDGSVSRTNGHQGSDGSAFRTNGHQGFDDSASRTNGHQGSDGAVFPTNGHQGSDGSAFRTNGHQGFDVSASRTNGHQGSDGAAFPTNGHLGSDGSAFRTNGHQGFEGSVSRTNGHQGSDGSVSRTNGHQGFDDSASRTNGHQGAVRSGSQTNGHQGTDVGMSKVPMDDNEIHPQCPIITGKQVANYWANPRDCTKYYGCLWGCVEELSCPGGYRWHDGKKACVEERLVRC